jgi:sodium-dependent dicarboxylate transporter 2/3/5
LENQRRKLVSNCNLPAQNTSTDDQADNSNGPAAAQPRRWIGLAAGLILAAIVYVLVPVESSNHPAGLGSAGRAVMAVAMMMVTLWLTEALPIAVTALLPIVLFPLCTAGQVTVKAAAAPYGHELIFLFMGGFMISLAMQRWGLHRRIALGTILMIGTRPDLLVAGLMVACAFLSMWVSNTATTVMMLPIATSVIELVRRELRNASDPNCPADGSPFNFAICLMLGIAYAASIGGIGTLIGTATNAFLAAFLQETYGIEISFVKWMAVTVPLVVVFLPITWFVLTRLVFPIRIRRIPGGRQLIRRELKEHGPMCRAELMVLIVFVVAALTWITRPLLVKLQLPGGLRPFAGLSDPAIAIGAAVLLFCLPVDLKKGLFVLSWQQAVKLPWGVLILFGGGLSLATAIKNTGVAEFIGQSVGNLQNIPVPVLVLMATATVVMVSQLTSNVATTAAFLPVFVAVAAGLGINPLLLAVPTTIAASLAFMMPVATPPNAIVFASGEITVAQMCKAGLWLNMIGIGLVMLLTYSVVAIVLKV